MDKESYERLFKGRIGLGAFEWVAFRSPVDLTITEKLLPVASFGDFFCPWFVTGDTLVRYRYALAHPEARPLRVCESELIDLDPLRAKTISEYRAKNNADLPILLAKDLTTGRTLILDGNKTSAAMWRNFDAEPQKNEKMMSVVQIDGKHLEMFIGDFFIVNR